MTDQPYTSQKLTRSYSPRLNSSKPIRQHEDKPGRMDLGMADKNVQPTVWSAVGYPRESEFTFDSFWLRYERQPEARAIIDKPVDDTWQEDPTIHDAEHEDQDEPVSEFEEKVEELLAGDHTRRQPTHRLKVADKLARLGEYSLLVFGFADGRALDTPVAGVQDDEEEPEFDGLDDLEYLATFGQDRIEDWELDTDMTSPRYRLPERIEVITEEPDTDDLADVADDDTDHETEWIHWTRFLHIPEGTLEDDLRGTPALKPVFHELLNIDRIRAASAEGFWRGGYQGIVVTPPDGAARGGRVEIGDSDEIQQKINRYLNDFDRTFATTGNVETLDANIGDPNPHIEVNYQAIEIDLDIPRSQWVGADRADTADEQAKRDWDTTVALRRNDHAEPVIFEPWIQRLIDVGILPEPSGDGFVFEWPSLDELSEKEEAEVLNIEAQAMNRVSPSGDPTNYWTMEEIREKFGSHPERGRDADEEYWPDEEEEEQMQLTQEAEQRMEEAMAQPGPGAQPEQQAPQQAPDGGEEQPPPEEDSE